MEPLGKNAKSLGHELIKAAANTTDKMQLRRIGGL
jgi:hypothetical protein